VIHCPEIGHILPRNVRILAESGLSKNAEISFCLSSINNEIRFFTRLSVPDGDTVLDDSMVNGDVFLEDSAVNGDVVLTDDTVLDDSMVNGDVFLEDSVVSGDMVWDGSMISGDFDFLSSGISTVDSIFKLVDLRFRGWFMDFRDFRDLRDFWVCVVLTGFSVTHADIFI